MTQKKERERERERDKRRSPWNNKAWAQTAPAFLSELIIPCVLGVRGVLGGCRGVRGVLGVCGVRGVLGVSSAHEPRRHCFTIYTVGNWMDSSNLPIAGVVTPAALVTASASCV